MKAAVPKGPIPLSSGILIVGALVLALWNTHLYAQRAQRKVTGRPAGQIAVAATTSDIRAWGAQGVVSAFAIFDLNPRSFLSSTWLDNASRGAGSISALLAANWSDGPGVMAFNGPLAFGAMLNDQDSLAGQCDSKSISAAFKAFVDYDLPGGCYLNLVTTCPVMCGDKHLIVPIGPSIDIIHSFWETPVDLQLGAYYESHSPDDGPGWQLRLMFQFPFPQ